jgi:hypothetical protein
VCVFGVDILNALNVTALFLQELPQAVCVQGLQHHGIRNMAAALSAAVAGKCDPVLGADGAYICIQN